MNKTLIRLLLFNLILGILITPLYFMLKTGVVELLFVYVPLLSFLITLYMDNLEKNENP